jgi:hypothetical protein
MIGARWQDNSSSKAIGFGGFYRIVRGSQRQKRWHSGKIGGFSGLVRNLVINVVSLRRSSFVQLRLGSQRGGMSAKARAAREPVSTKPVQPEVRIFRSMQDYVTMKWDMYVNKKSTRCITRGSRSGN